MKAHRPCDFYCDNYHDKTIEILTNTLVGQMVGVEGDGMFYVNYLRRTGYPKVYRVWECRFDLSFIDRIEFRNSAWVFCLRRYMLVHLDSRSYKPAELKGKISIRWPAEHDAYYSREYKGSAYGGMTDSIYDVMKGDRIDE